jgi:hypothetical protein
MQTIPALMVVHLYGGVREICELWTMSSSVIIKYQ